jgi:hypothetical protein
VPLAKPQSGVDALKGKFGRPTSDFPGVVDRSASSGRRVGRRGVLPEDFPR